jgi:hypothetical protein
MKLTQEQIDAALAFADGTETYEQLVLCEDASDEVIIRAYDGCINILAAAYRELREENNRLKPWADLAISSNALLAIEKSKNS